MQAAAPAAINPSVLIACAVCLLIAVLLENKFKIPLGITAFLSAFVISYVSFGDVPERILNYFPTSVVVPMIFSMMFFSIFAENGVTEYVAKKSIVLLRGKTKWYPLIAFGISSVLHLVFSAGALRYTLGPILLAIAAASGGDLMVPIMTLFLSSNIGAQNPFVGMVAATRPGYINSLGLTNVYPISIAMWLNTLIPLIILELFYFLYFRSWKAKDVDIAAAEAMELNDTQKKSLKLLGIVVFLLIVPSLINTIFPNPVIKYISSLCNTNIVLCAGIVAAVGLKITNWRSLHTKASMSVTLLIVGVTFLIRTAEKAGLQTMITGLAQGVPNWCVAPVVLLISAFLSFFVSAMTLPPLLYPMVMALAQSPAQLLTLLACVTVGSAMASPCPVSPNGAITLSLVPEKDRESVSGRMFIHAIVSTLIMTVIAAVGGLGIFSGLFASSVY